MRRVILLRLNGLFRPFIGKFECRNGPLENALMAETFWRVSIVRWTLRRMEMLTAIGRCGR